MTKVMTQLAALAPASPWPISGSPIAFLAGFVLFTTTGLCSARSMESRGGSGAKNCSEKRHRYGCPKKSRGIATLARRTFRDVYFDYDMEVEKCGMTA